MDRDGSTVNRVASGSWLLLLAVHGSPFTVVDRGITFAGSGIRNPESGERDARSVIRVACRLQAEGGCQCGNSIPNIRQISALPVAMKKSSVPLGEYSSMRVLAAAMIAATPSHAGGMP